MKPPRCVFCGRSFRDEGVSTGEFKTVRFADYQPLPKGMVGHPKGLAWFCGQHHAAAAELTMYSQRDALALMESSE